MTDDTANTAAANTSTTVVVAGAAPPVASKKLDDVIAKLAASLAAKAANLTALEGVADRLSSGASLASATMPTAVQMPSADTYPLEQIDFYLSQIDATDAEVARLITYLSEV